MRGSKFLKRMVFASSALVICCGCLVLYATQAFAAPDKSSLQHLDKAQVDAEYPYRALLDFSDGTKARITFLEDGIFRYDVDREGNFEEYATPRSKDHVARIQAQSDESSRYSHPKVTVNDKDGKVSISAGATSIVFDKDSACMSIYENDKCVAKETKALSLDSSSATQTFARQDGEQFFGGGTQNGRFNHTKEQIQIVNSNSWTDGGVSSPNPFYWSSAGYGVLRNTFATGTYDFAKSSKGEVVTKHGTSSMSAYYFVSDQTNLGSVAQSILQKYFKVTGNPALLPEYAFYLGHLNAYNRDSWTDNAGPGGKAWTIKDGNPSTSDGSTTYEFGRGTGYRAPADKPMETLNGHGPSVAAENLEATDFNRKYSAQAVIDRYASNDMPLGWFLPNDGYGAGYGQNGYYKTGGVLEDGSSSKERIAALDANVANLREFTNYANSHGVQTGLWTQAQLTPDSNPNSTWQNLRDFKKEVMNGGISALKTDVAWVGPGYSFGLNGIKTAYNTLSNDAHKRPNIVSLDGWAGTQRYAAVWTGDQYGGQWEYIRFHIPTYLGQSLSGNPNVASDMDGIFGGNGIVATRDYQWKSFTPMMLDMDGWGNYVKAPYTFGDPYTGINRMYLKLKSSLLPYIYTTAASAANIDTGNNDASMPIVRAMLFSDNSEYASSKQTQYQFTLGKDILVAPIYNNTSANAQGDDVRNGIYLPGESDEWVDFFTGEHYRGGQVINGFDAPLWKLPVFVRNGAILPMYEPNNNPSKKSATNPQGLDKTKRIVEFYPAGSTSYTLYEDDGKSISNDLKDVDGYGKEESISYNGSVSTQMTSVVEGDKATLTINRSSGSYSGYDPQRETTFVVNVSKKPQAVSAFSAEKGLVVDEVSSKDELSATPVQAGHVRYFYDEAPNLNTTPESENFSQTKIIHTPKFYVAFAREDVSAASQQVVIDGFANDGHLEKDQLNKDLATPKLTVVDDEKTPVSIPLKWDAVKDATTYELKVDGTLNAMGDATSFVHKDLAYSSTHTYQIRARNAEGYSAWSDPVEATSLADPWRNVPIPKKLSWDGGYYNNQKEKLAFDHNLKGQHFHSDGNAVNKSLTITYGGIYKLDRLEYYPRNDAGNGTVTKMRIETSLDGNNWTSREVTWDRSGDVKTVNFNGEVAAQYVRLTPLSSVGNFFSAQEIAIYKVDGSIPFEFGSNLNREQVSEADYSNMKNYLALEEREPDTATFDSQIKAHFADLNNNNIYDVYDYAATMSKLDGGTKQKGALKGNLLIVPSAQTVKAGDEIEVMLFADGVENANALGALVHYDTTKFAYVKDSLQQDPSISSMEDLSKIKETFADGRATANIAFANRGDKPCYSGSGKVASFKLRALKDGAVDLDATAIMVGPQFDSYQEKMNKKDEGEEPAEPQEVKLAQSAFNITMTNDELTTDSGSNVSKLIQQESYDNLFNGNTTYDGGPFEFKWNIPSNYVDGKYPSYVKLPTTIHFALKQPTELTKVNVYNRLNGNGRVEAIEGVITFADGSKQTFTGGDFAKAQNIYTFAVDKANASKKVKQVDITPLKAYSSAPGVAMLTLLETDFMHLDVVKPDSIAMGNNAKTLYKGDVSRVNVVVTPKEAAGSVEITSSNPEIASIMKVPTQDGVAYFVVAQGTGSATITATNTYNPDMKASYDVEVLDGINIAPLQQAMNQAASLAPSIYTPETYEAVQKAHKAAADLLAKQGYTKQDVEKATADLNRALSGLKTRPVDPKTLINTSAKSGVSVIDWSSQMTPEDGEDGLASNTLDYDRTTYWHTDYINHVGMPAYLTYDLGATYGLTDVSFLTRDTPGSNGDILKAEVLVANDPEAFAHAAEKPEAVHSCGTWTFENDGRNIVAHDAAQTMTFAPVTGRYVQLRVLESGGNENNAYASMGEIRFYGTPVKSLINTDDLKSLINTIEGKKLIPSAYTDETFVPFELALGDAKKTLADTTAEQGTVDAAHKRLQDSYNNLVSVPRSVKVSASDVHQGDTMTFTTTGVTPHENVTFTVHSEPVEVGKAEADDRGVASITWTVPADFEAGNHKVEATHSEGTEEAAFVVHENKTTDGSEEPTTPSTGDNTTTGETEGTNVPGPNDKSDGMEKPVNIPVTDVSKAKKSKAATVATGDLGLSMVAFVGGIAGLTLALGGVVVKKCFFASK